VISPDRRGADVLVLVRHGQTEANAAGRLLGRMDIPLSEIGRTQAAALGRAVEPARVISSPLARARETAAAFGVPVEVDDRWVELDYGELDGTAVTEVPAELWVQWQQDLSFTPVGGESLAALGQRVRDACDDLASDARARDVVVVTHVSPIKAAVAWALGTGDEVTWRLFVAVASMTVIGFTPRGPMLRSFNDIHHLGTPLQ
jgi:broad specificity phosphatase PhoE